MLKSLRTKILLLNKLIILLSFFPSLLHAVQLKPIESLDINTDEGLYDAFNRCAGWRNAKSSQIKRQGREEYRTCMGNSRNGLDDLDCEFQKVLMDGIAETLYEKQAFNFGKWAIVIGMELSPNLSFEFIKNNSVNSVMAYSQTYAKMGSRLGNSGLKEENFCTSLNQKYPPDDEDY